MKPEPAKYDFIDGGPAKATLMRLEINAESEEQFKELLNVLLVYAESALSDIWIASVMSVGKGERERLIPYHSAGPERFKSPYSRNMTLRAPEEAR